MICIISNSQQLQYHTYFNVIKTNIDVMFFNNTLNSLKYKLFLNVGLN
jgi:hypothetical protein